MEFSVEMGPQLNKEMVKILNEHFASVFLQENLNDFNGINFRIINSNSKTLVYYVPILSWCLWVKYSELALHQWHDV